MARPHHIASALALIVIVSLTTTGTADGQVPTHADFAACNAEAPKSVKAGSASPTTGDLTRADTVRGDATASSPRDEKGTGIESSDPQIHGMSAQGARNAAFQAAYRSCMRRKGF
jgi:hypothetical protein